MQILLYITIIILFLLVALLIMPLRVRICYQREGYNDEFSLEMALWKLPKYKLVTPLINLKVGKDHSDIKFDSKTKKAGFLVRRLVTTLSSFPRKEDDLAKGDFTLKIPHNFSEIKQLIKKSYQQFQRYFPFLKYLLSHTQCRHLHWSTKFGLEDAALTGWSTGFLWTAKSLLLSKFCGLVPLSQRPFILVQPEFNEKKFTIDFDCIFEVRLGHIMVTGIKLAFRK